MIFKHAEMLIVEKGELTGMREMRKHVAWYTAGYKNSAALRRKVNLVESFQDLEELLLTHHMLEPRPEGELYRMN